jgi:hypothetical protein
MYSSLYPSISDVVFGKQNTLAHLPMLLMPNQLAGADELVRRNATSPT